MRQKHDIQQSPLISTQVTIPQNLASILDGKSGAGFSFASLIWQAKRQTFPPALRQLCHFSPAINGSRHGFRTANDDDLLELERVSTRVATRSCGRGCAVESDPAGQLDRTGFHARRNESARRAATRKTQKDAPTGDYVSNDDEKAPKTAVGSSKNLGIAPHSLGRLRRVSRRGFGDCEPAKTVGAGPRRTNARLYSR